MADTIIRLDEIRKTFSSDFLRRRRTVLQGISLEVHRGETFAFLGHNGAGKTTTIKSLLGLIRIDSGSIELLGREPGDRSALSRIGYLPENPYFYDHLSGRELLGLMADLHGLSRGIARRRVGEILELVGMKEKADQRMRGYSKGMLQRIGLGQALINDPDLVVLDEPMGGLDPIGRHHIRAVIAELKARGKTIFMSSHILSDIEAIADRASILSDGVLRRIVELDEVGRGFRAMELQCRGLDRAATEALRSQGFDVDARNDVAWVRVEEAHLLSEAVLAVQRAGGVVLQAGVVRTNLEEVFVQEVTAGGSTAQDVGEQTREQVRRILDQISTPASGNATEVRS